MVGETAWARGRERRWEQWGEEGLDLVDDASVAASVVAGAVSRAVGAVVRGVGKLHEASRVSGTAHFSFGDGEFVTPGGSGEEGLGKVRASPASMAKVTEAAKAINEILTEEWERTNGVGRDKKIIWESVVPSLLAYHLEDLSMSSYAHH